MCKAYHNDTTTDKYWSWKLMLFDPGGLKHQIFINLVKMDDDPVAELYIQL